MTEVYDKDTPPQHTTGSKKTVLAHQWGTDMEVEGHLTTTVMNEGQAKPSPHACDLCGRTFPFLSALTKHMLKHAKEKTAKAPADGVKLENSLDQTSTEIQEEQEEEEQRREEEVKKKEEEVVEGEEEEKEGGVPEEQEGCSSPTESTSACNRVVNGGGGGGGEEKDAVKTQRKGAGRKERSTGSPCPLRQRKLRSQTEQERSSEGTPDEETLTCQLCGFEASSKEQLQNHEEKVHLPSDALASGEASPDEGAIGEGDLAQAGEYPCGQCDQVFTQAWFLKSHMKKHQGPLDHGCRICGRRFREPWFLRSHMKTHVIRAKPKAGDSEMLATINGVAQDEAALVNDVCLYELCAKCGNFFQDRQSLWLHEQVHERVSGGRGCDAEKENEPLPNNANDSKTPVSKKAFLECLNLRPVGSTEKTAEESSVSRIPELDPISSYQTWHLATRGRVVEASEHGLGWEERLADADVAYDREKGEYVLLKQEKKKKQQLVATPANVPNAAKKRKTTNTAAGEKNGHGSSGDVSPESHSDSEYRPTTSNSRRASQNKTSECLECGKGFRSQQQMVIHMLIRHGGGSGFGAGLESSAPIFGDAALSFLTNAAFRDPKLAGQTKDTDKKPSSDRHSALKHNTGSSSSHQQGSVPHSNSSASSATRLSLAGESTEGTSALEPDRQPDGLLRHRCPFCTHSTLYPEVLWIHQRVAHKVNSSSTLAPKWALRNGFKGPRSSLEFRRRTGPPPFLEGKDCPALTETRKPRTQPPTQGPSAEGQSGLKSDSTGTSEPSPSKSRGHLHKPSSSACSSSSASNSSSKPKTSSSNVSGGTRKRAADSSPATNSSGTPKKPAAHTPSPKMASRAAASSLLPQEGLHFVLASQHGHDEQGKAAGATAPSSQRREDSPAPTPNSVADSTLQNSSRRTADTLGAYPADASQLDVLSFLKNCSPTELAALYHHWGLGTTAMLDQAGAARSLFQQMKYVCPVCGKSFSQPSHYRTHMRSHTGERPFRCRYCPYSASQKGNLKTHVQTVHRVAFDNTSYTDGRLRREAHPEEDSTTTTHGPLIDQEDHLDAKTTDSQVLSDSLG